MNKLLIKINVGNLSFNQENQEDDHSRDHRF